MHSESPTNSKLFADGSEVSHNKLPSAQEKPQVAEIVAVGPGGVVDGKEVEMYVKVGDRVITGQYSGTKVKLNKEEYTIVRQSDILAIVED